MARKKHCGGENAGFEKTLWGSRKTAFPAVFLFAKPKRG